MASKKETTIATVPTPGQLVAPDYGDQYGEGFEHQTNRDVKMPMFKQLQGLSPEVKDGRGKEGQWMNVGSGAIFDSFYFVMATTRHQFAKWKKDRGGFRGHLDPDDPLVIKTVAEAPSLGQNWIQEDELDTKTGRHNKIDVLLQETFYAYGVVCTDDGLLPDTMACIAFASTKIPVYQGFMGTLRTPIPGSGQKRPPPLFANLLWIGSRDKKNAKGEFKIPWIRHAYGDEIVDGKRIPARIRSLLAQDDERFVMAMACKQLMESGAAKIDYDQDRPADAEEIRGSGPSGAAERTFG